MDIVYLVLENGMAFAGHPIGAWKGIDPGIETVGELVFTTGMTGYLETLTDPSYAGQIILQTFPMIGNYGLIPEDFEGACHAKGYVVRELCDAPSNFRSEGTLDTFLKEQGIPGICGVDTRALTRLIREQGVMNACLCRSVPEDLKPVKAYAVQHVVSRVSTPTVQVFEPWNAENGSPCSTCPSDHSTFYNVALLDYGAKRNIIRSLQKRGCRVTLLPHDTTAEEILAMAPDGLMLSNGPGDPAENVFEVEQLRKLVGKLPIFGICLGHQLCALAMGGKTYKLKYGHRGANQPVTDGVYPGKRCFTVQFHPEACAGPHDTEFLFDRFLRMMRGEEE